MSHFDDIDGVGDIFDITPGTFFGILFALIVVGLAFFWAYQADKASMNECAKHGEKYVDSRAGYTLCETDAGVAVVR